MAGGIGSTFMDMVGNNAKALIELVDARNMRNTILDNPVQILGEAQSMEAFLAGSNLPASAAQSAAKIASDNIVSNAAVVLGGKVTDKEKELSGENLLTGPGMAGTLSSLKDVNGKTMFPTKKFYVQFNPSELSLSGYGGGLVRKSNFIDPKKKENNPAAAPAASNPAVNEATGADKASNTASSVTGTDKQEATTNELTYEKMDVRIMLSVKLIFDEADPFNAFMADKLNTGYTALTENIVKAAASKKYYSVQPQVEAFMGALRSKYTRQVIFSWGNLSYSGVLNNISAQYTMFNVIGAPIRATVDLKLLCADGSVGAHNMGSWYQAYKEAFGAGSQSYVKTAQKVGNLLNFNL